jgi:RNA polymerase sigma factor (sigma-70 family)
MKDRILSQLAEQSVSGDKAALEQLVELIQDKIYSIAVRMLWHPDDAKDATQDILLRVITHLGSFRGDSSFLTWVYRIAANHLVTTRKSRLEKESYSFERFARELDEGLADPSFSYESDPDYELLLEEVRVGCTLGMLLCLDRPHRLAYILGEILELDSKEAAQILEITPGAFRKRLSRARSDIVGFMRSKCGLVNPGNTCRCSKRLERALESNRVDPKRLLFAKDLARARRFPGVLDRTRSLEEARRVVALYRTHPQFIYSTSFSSLIDKLIDD